MQFEEWKDVVLEPEKGSPLHALGEVLKAYKKNIIRRGHRPYGLGCEEARREHDDKMKVLDYQLGYALYTGFAVLKLRPNVWQQYLELLQEYVVRVEADLSNYREVAKEVHQEIEVRRGQWRAAATSGVLDKAMGVDSSVESWDDNVDNYAY
ncbi:hypothetical protein [Parachryseolinea silvisoli]|uniref:hypothetical protein n=1 Tax=Parachryseolinea silvisoli TaxID=2873601 RepID=UPI002265CEB3|nr:hypothetical protein [Parachryseolinea silvisoli]MCD9015186.1 hypothetical protein [Parachryseolinea silvisoli]